MRSKDSQVPEQTESISHEEIAVRAYALWEQRGCPIGSPEEDWLCAEEEIRQRVQSAGRGKPTRARAASAG